MQGTILSILHALAHLALTTTTGSGRDYYHPILQVRETETQLGKEVAQSHYSSQVVSAESGCRAPSPPWTFSDWGTPIQGPEHACGPCPFSLPFKSSLYSWAHPKCATSHAAFVAGCLQGPGSRGRHAVDIGTYLSQGYATLSPDWDSRSSRAVSSSVSFSTSNYPLPL